MEHQPVTNLELVVMTTPGGTSNQRKGKKMDGGRNGRRIVGGLAFAALTCAASFAVVELAGPAVAAPTAPVKATGLTPVAPVEAPASASTEFGVNSHGQTFGSSANGAPDLVRVLSRDGTIGYVYEKDLNQPDPTSPAEAAKQEEAGRAGRTIPIYDSEGEKVIGSFFVGGVDSTVDGPPEAEPTAAPSATSMTR